MKSKIFPVAFVLAVALYLLNVSSVVAQERMKYEDYQLQLTEWQDREAAAQTRIAELEKEIGDLRTHLSDLKSQLDDVYSQMWSALSTTEQGFENYLDQLDRLSDQIRGLLNLSPSELYKQKDEAERLKNRLEELGNRDAAKHPRAREILDDLARLERRLDTAVANAAPPFDVYTVMRGDYLWKIAKNPEVYNDPFQWIRIYTKNRDLIKDPDMIYPKQEFKIFHDLLDGEYLVQRGDNLSKIAGRSDMLGDPFKWTELYELNKSVIADKDVIYPYMILYTR